MGKRSCPHPPDYSLPPGTMVAGRYMVQAYLGESEEAIYYRCYDQMRKTVVELMEFFPVGQVQRFQSSGDRRLHPIYGHEEEFVRAANHFAGIYPNHVQDHGTVYAVRTNKKSSKIGILLVSMFVLCLILGVIMEVMRSGNSGIPGDETLTYANGDYLFRPGIENICYDEESSVIYFDRILLVYLDSEFTEEEAKRLSSIVNGEVVGEVKGIMNILQLKLAKSDFSRMEALAVRLMEEENVLFAGYDYPTVLESTGLQGYDYNRWGKTDLVYPGTSRTDPYTEKVYYCEFDEDSPSGNEWWAEAIGAYTAWTYAEYGENYTVGIIDSGVDIDDPELKGRATSLAGIANHSDSHGTFVAGLIGAEDNNDGIRGVADNSKMLTADWEEKPQGDSLSYGYDPLEDLRGLKNTQSDDEIPANYLDSVEIFELHKQMLEQGVRVVNDSWTRYLMPENEFDRWYKLARIRPNNRPAEHVMTYEEYKSAYESVNYRTALDAMLCIDQLIKSGKKDFLFIQAAGNGFGNYMINGTDSKNAGYFASITSEHYEQFNNSYDQHLSHTTTIPFELVYGYGKLTIPYEEIREHVMIVSAVDVVHGSKDYHLYEGANYGTNVDICAPGVDIWNYNKNKLESGTSFAAPMVSASAARLWSVDPSMSVGQVRDYLLQYAQTATSDREGQPDSYPMLDIGASMTALAKDMGLQPDLNMYKKRESETGESGDDPTTDITPALTPALTPEPTPKEDISALLSQYLKDTLAIQYGIMTTEPWRLSEDREAFKHGNDAPMNGILSALIHDLDSDGKEELVTVRFTPGEEAKMYLEVYEAADGAVSLADAKTFSVSQLAKNMNNVRTAVFLGEKNGTPSLYVYGFERLNGGGDEAIRELTYQDQTLSSKNYWTYGMGSDGSVYAEYGTVSDISENPVTQIFSEYPDTPAVGTGSDVVDAPSGYASEEEYRKTAGGIFDKYYGILKDMTGLLHGNVLAHGYADIDGYTSFHKDTGKDRFTAKDLFTNASEYTWIAAMDSCLDDGQGCSPTQGNMMVPADYTGIVR